jgi:hypothetical protein
VRARRPGFALAARISERFAAFALEIGDAGFVRFQINHVADNQSEHKLVTENARATEHALDRYRAERRKQIADEIRVHAPFELCETLA